MHLPEYHTHTCYDRISPASTRGFDIRLGGEVGCSCAAQGRTKKGWRVVGAPGAPNAQSRLDGDPSGTNDKYLRVDRKIKSAKRKTLAKGCGDSHHVHILVLTISSAERKVLISPWTPAAPSPGSDVRRTRLEGRNGLEEKDRKDFRGFAMANDLAIEYLRGGYCRGTHW